LASYLAAGKLLFEPCMMAVPSIVDTHHLHFRPRLFKAVSKVGNRSGMAKESQAIILNNKAYKG
jgi:hypothetical protein